MNGSSILWVPRQKLQLTFESVRWSHSFFLQNARGSRYLSLPRWLLLWPVSRRLLFGLSPWLLTGLPLTLTTLASVCSVATWMVLSGVCARSWCPPGPPGFTQAVGLHHLSTLYSILHPLFTLPQDRPLARGAGHGPGMMSLMKYLLWLKWMCTPLLPLTLFYFPLHVLPLNCIGLHCLSHLLEHKRWDGGVFVLPPL